MSPQRKKGLLRLLGVAVFVAVVAAVVFFWPFKSDNTPGTEAEAAPKPSPSATAPASRSSSEMKKAGVAAGLQVRLAIVGALSW